jgi:hypothetical protein
MTLYIYNSVKDSDTTLIVPTKAVPADAENHPEAPWKFSGTLDDVTGKDRRFAMITEADMLQQIEENGFAISRSSITSTVSYPK